MLKGKLIAIEGSDGSGKNTQSKNLYKKLVHMGKKVKLISFPNYTSQSSSVVKMYLEGELGDNALLINPYSASTLFASDRIVTYFKELKDFYENGGIIIADRYTPSNAIHQAAKITDEEEKTYFLNWLFDFEYNKCQLPKPDIVIFLDVTPSISFTLLNKRNNNKHGKKDIHEKDFDFLNQSYLNAKSIAEKYNWEIINCCLNESLLSVKEIEDKIIYKIKKAIF